MTNPISSDDAFDDRTSIIRPYVSKPEREGRLIRGVAPNPSTVDVRLTGTGRPVLLMARMLHELVEVTKMSHLYPAEDGRKHMDLTVIASTTRRGAL